MFAFSFLGVRVALPPAGSWRNAEVLGGAESDFGFA
jgi:hypothetical protein